MTDIEKRKHPKPIFWRLISAGLLIALLAGACQPAPPNSTPTPKATRAATGPTAPAETPPPTRDTPPTATPPPVSQIQLTATDLEDVQIVFWHPFSGAGSETLSQLADAFNAANEWGIQVRVEADAGPDALEQRVNAALLAGYTPGEGLPDVVAGYLHQALAWDEQHPLVNLRSYVDDPIWGYTLEEQSDFNPAFWEQDVADERRVGAPFQRTAQVLVYNRTWARELGFGLAPLTPQQLADQTCIAAEANRSDGVTENDGTGGLLVMPHYAAALSWIYSFGGDILRQPEPAAGQNVYRFNTPAASDAFAFLRDLYDERCAWTLETGDPLPEFAARRALLTAISLTELPYLAQGMQQTGSRDDWTVIAYPSPEQAPGLATYGPSLQVFTSTEARQLAAWLFVQWLLQPENHARWVEASGGFPLRQSELAALEAYRARSPQWTASLALLPSARPEPAYVSWDRVRWAVADAFTQLFRSYFAVEQIPTMLNFLDHTVEELHERK